MQSGKIRIGITHGDPNGIGYEIIMGALRDSRMVESCTFVIYGNRGAMEFYKRTLAGFDGFEVNYIGHAGDAVRGKINFVNIGEPYTPRPGAVDPVAGGLAIASLRAAVRDAKSGGIDCLVTCPIDKRNTSGSNLGNHADGSEETFGFIGHTEYLAHEFGDSSPLMFMISDMLRVGLVTMHIPLEKVVEKVTTENVLEHIRLMRQSLERDFTIRGPKIAVLGLNPHSGDGGLIGDQEARVIIPAIDSAKYEGTQVFGPFAADGFFGSGEYKKFDAVLAMYHDQGLAPFKALSFEDGVNFTAGLSVVRTSPAHGVGYDIAGQGVASCSPMRAAIYEALDIFGRRAFNEEISSNPMKRFSPRPERRGGFDGDGGGSRGNRGGHIHEANAEDLINSMEANN